MDRGREKEIVSQSVNPQGGREGRGREREGEGGRGEGGRREGGRIYRGREERGREEWMDRGREREIVSLSVNTYYE